MVWYHKGKLRKTCHEEKDDEWIGEGYKKRRKAIVK